MTVLSSSDVRRLLPTILTNDESSLMALLKSGEVQNEEFTARDASGRTCLSYAAALGNVTMIDLLQATLCVDPNQADNDGNPPLTYAVSMGHIETTKKLLKWEKMNIDQQNNSGFTPLMKAAMQGHPKCIEALVKAGASLFSKDHVKQMTALEWAKYCGSHMCLKTLGNHVLNARLRGHRSKVYTKDKLNQSVPDLRQLALLEKTTQQKIGPLQKLKTLLFHHKENEHQDSLGIKAIVLCGSTPAIPLLVSKSEDEDQSQFTDSIALFAKESQLTIQQLNLSPSLVQKPSATPKIEITTDTGEVKIPSNKSFREIPKRHPRGNKHSDNHKL